MQLLPCCYCEGNHTVKVKVDLGWWYEQKSETRNRQERMIRGLYNYYLPRATNVEGFGRQALGHLVSLLPIHYEAAFLECLR